VIGAVRRSRIARSIFNRCPSETPKGPLTFLRGSHLGPLHSMYDDSGAFVVHVSDEVAASIPADMVATATGGPGTTVLLNCRTIHGSVENRSDRARPLLLPGLFLGRFISLYSQSDCQPASWRHCARAPSALRLLRHASVRATSRLPRWIQSSLVGSARRGEQSWHSVEDVGDTTGTIQTDLSCAARGAVADYSGLRIAEMVRLPTQALFIS
jgi:ectoine hydroxylase-related dioxygenase (phytanoyl-CoA dioxygenase family)